MLLLHSDRPCPTLRTDLAWRASNVRSLLQNRICSRQMTVAGSMHMTRASKEERSLINNPVTPQRVGVLGGGQLGKMLGLAAASMGVQLKVLDPAEICPAGAVAEHTRGNFNDFESVKQFVTEEDILTVEIEHINVEALRWVQENTDTDVEPTPKTLEIIQDKFKQKEHFNNNGIAVTSYIDISGPDTADLAVMVLEFPFMLKAKRLAFDGRGNAVVRAFKDLEGAVNSLGGYKQGLYGERWVSFTKELAVMVARSLDGRVCSFPVTETVHKDSICYVTHTPAQIPEELRQQAQDMAEKAVGCLDGAGIFGVEMFLVDGGKLLLNEVAPRPHNSGHYTIEACHVSQFEQHLRAVLGLPLGDPSLKVESSIMLNILGEDDGEPGAKAAAGLIEKAYRTPGAVVHWYGKKGFSANRKLGHINVTGETVAEAFSRLANIEPAAAEALERSKDAFQDDWAKVQAERKEGSEKKSGGGPPVLAVAVEPAVSGGEITRQGSRGGLSSEPRIPHNDKAAHLATASTAASSALAGVDPVKGSHSGPGVEVAVIMGSDSDLSTMRGAAEVLTEMGVQCEVTVVSAHRTPDRMLDFARSAHKRGLKVIIAGAGGAAHLPGMVAALTPLPVIGVPVTPPGSHLDGLDALLSIVQMPRGVPVATVAVGNATNAGLLAIRILSCSRPELLEKMLAYQESMRLTVMKKAETLEQSGWKEYHVRS